MNAQQLVPRRPSTVCAFCGVVVAMDDILCVNCLGPRHAHAEQRQRLLDSLKERRRLGEALGNKKAVVYPSGIDIGLRRLLDALRTHQIEVRMELMPSDPPSPCEIRDGYLRRVRDDVSDDSIMGHIGALGLFTDPADADPREALEDDAYERIVRISVIDELVIGGEGPRVVWDAPPESLAHHQQTRARQMTLERRSAIWLLIHIVFVVLVIVGFAVPFLLSIYHKDGWRAAAWGPIWSFVSIVVGSTLGCWETLPDLSLLWKRNGDRRMATRSH